MILLSFSFHPYVYHFCSSNQLYPSSDVEWVGVFPYTSAVTGISLRWHTWIWSCLAVFFFVRSISMVSHFSKAPIVCCATVVPLCINNTDYKFESDVSYRVHNKHTFRCHLNNKIPKIVSNGQEIWSHNHEQTSIRPANVMGNLLSELFKYALVFHFV